jgi:hypothetical protein
MSNSQYLDILLKEMKPQNIFIKIIQRKFEYPNVIFILRNQYTRKVYCTNLKDEIECMMLIYQQGYKRTSFEMQTQDEKYIGYSLENNQ